MYKIILTLTFSIFSIMNGINAQTESTPFAKLDGKTAQALIDFYKFWETGDEKLLTSSTSKKLKDHDRNPMIEGTDYQAILGTGQSLKGLSKMMHTFTEVLPQEDGRIVIRWQGSAIHSGEAFGIPATGRTIYFNGHDILRLENGKIIELWHIEQLLQMTAQMQ